MGPILVLQPRSCLGRNRIHLQKKLFKSFVIDLEALEGIMGEPSPFIRPGGATDDFHCTGVEAGFISYL